MKNVFQTTSAIIMASGSSKRMGRNKLFLQFGGQTFLQRVIELALKAGFYEVIVVISRENAEKCSFPDKVTIVYNELGKTGQSASVRLGASSATGTGFLFLPVDQPLLTLEVLEKIVAKSAPDKIVFPTQEGRPSSPVFFGADFYNELSKITGHGGGRKVRDRHPEAWIPVEIPGDYLKDIDMPEDYERLLEEKG